MANRIELATVTVPNGTLSTAPFTQAIPFDDGDVDGVEILVPPGPSGLVGFQITYSGVPVIPRESDRWIVADAEVIKWALAGFPDGGGWGVRAYNTDVFDHTLYFRFLVTESAGAVASSTPAIPVDQPDQPAPSDEQQPGDVPSIVDLLDYPQTGGTT